MSNVVLVHGFGCWAGDWDAVVERLPGEVTCHVPELAGHGQRAAEAGPYTLDRAAQEIGESLDGDAVVLVGHSMGTRIAIQIAAQYTQSVRALVLIDGSCLPDDPKPEPEYVLDEVSLYGLTPDQRRAVVDRAARLSKQASDGWINDSALWDRDEAAQSVNAVHCPVHLLQSTNFTRPPDCRRRPIKDQPESLWFDMWTHFPACTIQCIERAGHYLPIERPELVARLVAICLDNASEI